MPAEYSFVSRWEVAAPPERVWSELERMVVESGTEPSPSWWPAVSITRRAARLARGERVEAAVRSPLGYRLRVRLVIERAEPTHVLTATSGGDLDGRGRLRIDPAGGGASTIEIDWRVVTRRAWMNRTAWLLRPLFERAHAHVMAAGARGLRRRLEARAN